MGIESPIIRLSRYEDMEFHDHLRRLRESTGLTQAQTAEAVDIAKNTYIGYEKGSREPRLSELKKLAALFNIGLGELCLEAQEAGLSGLLKAAMERAEKLAAKEKAALLEVMRGYINSRLVAQISDDGDWYEERELEEILQKELEDEHFEKMLDESKK